YAHAQDPNFSNTTDILNGQRRMLRADDVAVVYQAAAQQAPYTSTLHTDSFLTENSQVTQGQFLTTTVPGASALAHVQVQAALGRMFDQATDVLAVAAQEADPANPTGRSLYVTVYDRANSRTQRVLVMDVEVELVPTSVLMADFTGDGYDDLVVSFNQGSSDAAAGFATIVTAADPQNWAAGLVVGPLYFDQPIQATAFAGMTAADVDGDGQLEIVATRINNFTANGPQIVVLSVDPKTLTITQAAATNLPTGGYAVQVVSGDWDANPTDDEVVFVESPAANALALHLQLYDFGSPTPNAILLNTLDVPGAPTNSVVAAGAQVDWTGGDAIVVAGQYSGSYSLSIFTALGGVLEQQATYSDSANGSLMDLALGRFDNRTASGQTNPDLQAAALLRDQGTNRIVFYDLVSDHDYAITADTVYTFASPPAGAVPELPVLAAGDLQGRSLLLGAPAKIVNNGYSGASTVVGSPPMHIDWVVPSCADPNYPNNCSTPQVVNILAKPASNYAQFNTQVKENSQSSSQPTTSYGFATEGSFGLKTSFGIPDLVSAGVDVEIAGGEVYNNSTTTTTTSYESTEFDASVRTGFADHVWFGNYRFNVWTYPIIGKTACPLGKPNCLPIERLPLHFQISGPDQVQNYDLDGNVVEWYQPVWEPGNVLSYPWTEEQLLALLPRTYISNKSNVWAADSSGSNASVTWSQGGGQDISQATSLANNSSASISASAGFSIEGNGISASAGITHTSNDSSQTLNTSSNTHGASTGFAVSRTAQGVADYVYTAQTYILGQGSMPGTVQTLPLTSTLVITGPLRLAYWADPYDPVAGGAWWGTAYALPDVALNHPQRWTWTNGSSDPNIMTFNQAVTSTSPFDQEFYRMRGLYVTNPGAPDGMQVTTAAVDDTVLLQARVYNYSHLDMNDPSLAQPAAKVKVEFYGQLFKSDSGEYPVGNSFFIGESVLPPIPGYNSATTPGDVPNWSMAAQLFSPQNFSQTQNGNVYVRFWVVVWMEDAQGNLVQEMPGHGLTAKPGATPLHTLGDVAVEPYSNNAGTLKQVFYVQSAVGTAAGSEMEADKAETKAGTDAALTMTLEALQIVAPMKPPTMDGPKGKHQVTAVVKNGQNTGPLVLVYYDGDPAHGGQAFEWEMIPYIAAETQYVNRVTYTPQACGPREIYVVARQGSEEAVRSMTIENVPCTLILPWVGK
ncbi:MAG: hypothetical protein U0X20_26095, partial [Caldilineaceae bacterium]